MINQKGEFLYEGKAKKIHSVKNSNDLVWMEFKDSLTAFNAQKKGSFSDKGIINRKITVIIFEYLKSRGINTHFVEEISDRDLICKKVDVIPIEVVVRNILAGSTAKKFGIEEGKKLDKPLIEFYLKKDELNDPFMSDDQALMLGLVKDQNILEELKQITLKINDLLIELFKKCQINLVDFKIEFGKDQNNNILLADEISPDSCRLWDLETNEKLDKDRFRRDLGKIEESYREVLNRLEKAVAN